MADSLTADNLRRAFLGALGTSILLMVTAKWFHLPTLVVVLAPILVMLFYLRNFLVSDNADDFREQFADSFYALGFLLTLTALVITFFPFFLGRSSITIEGTLGNFGVALLTTLLGLTVRIYLTSFAMDLEQTQKQVVLQFERDVRQFKEEMGASIEVMKQFNAELEKTTKETVDDFGQSLSGAGEQITLLVQGTMKEAFEPLGKTFADLAEDVGKATEDFGKDLDASFKQCVESVEAIQLQPNALGDALKPALEAFDKAVRDIDQSVRTTAQALENSSGELDSSMGSFSSSVSAMNKNLTTSLEHLVAQVQAVEIKPEAFTAMLEASSAEFTEAVRQAAEQTRKHGSALEEEAEAVHAALPVYGSVAESLQRIAEMNKELEQSMGQFAEMTARFQAVAQDIDSLGLKTRDYIEAVADSVDLHKQKSRDLEAEHAGIRSIRAELEREYREIHDKLQELGGTFAQIAAFVAQNLRQEKA